MTCPSCNGTGEYEVVAPVTPSEETGGLSELHGWKPCDTCNGTGQVPDEAGE